MCCAFGVGESVILLVCWFGPEWLEVKVAELRVFFFLVTR